jgi:transposase
MSRRYKPYSPEHHHLLPPSPQDWLPDDHLAYMVRDVVKALDLGAFHRSYCKDPRGALPFDPRMMVSILLYAWCSDIYSSRKISMLCTGDLGGRYLAAGLQPDFRSINTFRLRHGDALADLFVQSVRICQAAGMVSLGVVAIDGSKIAANASKRKAMSYGRMVRAEEDLRLQIAEIQRRSNEADSQEDSLFGKDNIGFDVPKELKRHETRLAKILEAKKQLEAEARQAAEAKAAAHKAKQSNKDDGKPRRGPKPKEPEDPEKAVPKDSAQRGFTDPDSRIMKSGTGEWMQGYNAQASVDGDCQVILVCGVTQDANDKRMCVPMVEETIAQVGFKPGVALLDPGFYSEENAKAMEDMGVDVLIPPDRERCGTPDNPAPAMSEEAFAALSTKEKMRHRVSTAEGRDAYRLRKGIVEPVFGQIKGSAGNPGYLGFLRRGLPKVTQEWSWVCATHNFLKYIRFQAAQKAPPAPPKQKRSSRRGQDCAFRTVEMAI